jgi:hypothetical protein
VDDFEAFMIPPDEYAAAVRGNDPEMAFVRLESKFRDVLNKNLEGSNNTNAYNMYVIEYMNHTIAAARALGFNILDQWTVPSHGSRGFDLSDHFKDFTTAVVRGAKVLAIRVAEWRGR